MTKNQQYLAPRMILMVLSISSFLIAKMISPSHTQAQNLSVGVAQYVPLEGNIPDGSIISLVENKYRLSTEPYDKSIVGVMSNTSAMEIRYESQPSGSPVVNNGRVSVRVNAENGPIRVGDRLTSSSVPGVAMRAPKTGFILGIAQEDFVPTGAADDAVLVDVKIGFDFAADSPKSEQIGTRMLSVLSSSALALKEDPLTVFRYVLGSVVTLATLIFAFFTFGRAVRNGTEALGRNPIAAPQIVLAMLLNVVICLAILGSGLGAAYAITVI